MSVPNADALPPRYEAVLASSTNGASVAASDSYYRGVPISPLKSTNAIIKDLTDLDKHKMAKTSFDVISTLAGNAMGVFSALALFGIMVSPVGWGIAGGCLLIAATGIAMYGSPYEFVRNLLLAVTGFTTAMSLALMGLSFATQYILLGMAFEVSSILSLFPGMAVFSTGSNLRTIIEERHLDLGIVGVEIDKATLEGSELDYLEGGAVLITKFEEGSAATKTGLKPDDIIILCNGKRIENLASLSEQLKSPQFDSNYVPYVPVTAIREGKEVQLNCILPTKTIHLEFMGMSVLAQKNENGFDGFVIANVADDGIADRVGLKKGDFILGADDKSLQVADGVEIFSHNLRMCQVKKESCNLKISRGPTGEAQSALNCPIDFNNLPEKKVPLDVNG